MNWLGDAIMATPALLRLREAKPSAHIALATSAKLADLWHSHPAIDEVIPFTRAEGTGHLSKRLRQGNFTSALILPNSFRSAFECWLAGIPKRIGFAANGRGLFLTQVVPRRREEITMHKRSAGEIAQLIQDTPEKPRDRYPASGHQVHDYLVLASALGASPLPTPPRIAVPLDELTAFRERIGIAGDLPIVGLNPGAEYGPAKRWPAERFIAAATQVERSRRCAWILTGGPADHSLTHEIATGIQQLQPSARIHNLAGKTTLRELCAALALCQVVLTNDTGPMHLAAALGTLVVVPFGSTSPELTGPGLADQERHKLILGQAPCAPCFLRTCPIDFRCMLSISPSQIARELLHSLDAAQIPTP